MISGRPLFVCPTAQALAGEAAATPYSSLPDDDGLGLGTGFHCWPCQRKIRVCQNRTERPQSAGAGRLGARHGQTLARSYEEAANQ